MKTAQGIPETHTVRHGTDYGAVWSALSSLVYRVVDEEGVNMADAQIRHLLGRYWLYVDDQDGYSVVHEGDVEYLTLVHDED